MNQSNRPLFLLSLQRQRAVRTAAPAVAWSEGRTSSGSFHSFRGCCFGPPTGVVVFSGSALRTAFFAGGVTAAAVPAPAPSPPAQQAPAWVVGVHLGHFLRLGWRNGVGGGAAAATTTVGVITCRGVKGGLSWPAFRWVAVHVVDVPLEVPLPHWDLAHCATVLARDLLLSVMHTQTHRTHTDTHTL